MKKSHPQDLLNIRHIIDDAKCFQTACEVRCSEGVRCPHCDSRYVIKHDHDESQPYRQKYRSKRCPRYFDLTNTIFEGQHQPLSA